MRKIAVAAIALALLSAVANIHVASAESAPQDTSDSGHTTAQVTNTTNTAAQTTPATPAPAPVTQTVVPGDTLSGIAADHATTYTRLYDANTFIVNPNLIYPGQIITVPNAGQQLTDRTPATTAPAADTTSASTTPAPAADPIVTVQSGDSLSSIAQAYGTTADRLFDANGAISDPNVLQVGEQLTVPSADEQLTDRTPAVSTAAASTPAPAAAPAAAPAPAVTQPAPATTSYTVSDNAAKAYIYAHESSNNPDATNYLGCYGLGQDCSGVLRQECGDNYDCQDRFFDNYAVARYGGWANAQAFWEAHHWW